MSAIVFLASFCLMLVQVVSGRALAPHLGVSVFTWTAVIGTTLLGIAFGNAAGGRIADMAGGKKNLGISLIAAAGSVLLANYLLTVLAGPFSHLEMHVAIRAVLMSFVFFLPSAFFLSTISPQALKIRLSDLTQAGTAVGTLSAWSAAGSILGTFAGGYVLISAIGTKNLLTAVVCILIVLGLGVSQKEKLWKTRPVLLIGLFFVGDLFVPGLCKMETDYFCIRVIEAGEGAARTYTLRLDHLIHSYVTPENPTELGYGYERVYANLIAMRQKPEDAFTAYFIGGGGYVMPRYLEAKYPNAKSIVAEIDPGVTEANHRYMELSRNTKIQSINEDARIHLIKPTQDPKYDFAFGDAFNDFSVPSHLTTVEFHQRLKSRMSDNGVYALNIIDDVRYGNFLSSMIRTLRSVWTYVYVAPLNTELEEGRNTITLITTDQPIDRNAWYAARPFAVGEKDELTLLSDEQVDKFLESHRAPALTDDFAPTDRYLAPVFRDAY